MKLEFFAAPAPNGVGVLVVPGGGYGMVAIDHEGHQVAQWLNERGYDAWVLTYTVASEATPAPIFPAPQNEALAAVAAIRATGRVEKLGIWGFSAGGHLSAVTATDPDASLDFAVLAYPVIDMGGPWMHEGSHSNLLFEVDGEKISAGQSAHERVSALTPPTFLFHTANDSAVVVQNSLLFAFMLAEHKVPFELHVLPDGPHGVGLALGDPRLNWTDSLERWLKER